MIDKLLLKIHNSRTPWHEKAKLITEFHIAQIKANGHKDHKGDLGWSLRETANTLNLSKGHVHRAIFCYELIVKSPKIVYKYDSISECYLERKGNEK